MELSIVMCRQSEHKHSAFHKMFDFDFKSPICPLIECRNIMHTAFHSMFLQEGKGIKQLWLKIMSLQHSGLFFEMMFLHC